MINVNDYLYYVYVIEKKGFSSAEKALGIPKSRLSRHISQLEERLGVKLIHRNSRQFIVTDIGQEFYRHARAALNEIESAEALVKKSRNEISGNIRITCSIGVAQFALKNLIIRFMAKHPRVKIGQFVTNENINLIEKGFDLGIRGYDTNLPNSGLFQRKLAKVYWTLTASPGYLKQHGTPDTPEELYTHSCLKLGSKPEKTSWNLHHSNGDSIEVPIDPILCSDDMVTLKSAAIEGMGITALPEYVTRPDIENNRLTRILPEWSTGQATISLITPTRKGTLPEVAEFSDFLVKEFPKVVAV